MINPPDRHGIQTLKSRVYRHIDDEFEEYGDTWDLEGISSTEKRMMAARLVSEEWAKMCANDHHLILSAFTGTGWLIANNGTENHLIKLWKLRKGVYAGSPDGTPYSFASS